MSERRTYGTGKRILFVVFIVLLNVAIFAMVDFALVKLDLFRPPFRYGIPVLGFGHAPVITSDDYGATRTFGDSSGVVIAMVGDSHSALSFDNMLDRHEFVLEAELRKQDIPAVVVSCGRGRYSPLQEYLLYKSEMKAQYDPGFVLMNFYSGNDFYDMLRPDDRPHFARGEDGTIELRPPVWYALTNPDARSWRERSRVIWGLNRIGGVFGYPRILTRLKMLGASARQSGGSTLDAFRYMRDVRRSIAPGVEYEAAFSAQILNQAIFFKYFPSARAESIAFVTYLMKMARRENPDVVFVMSPIPSAILADAIPEDLRELWEKTLGRVGLSEEDVFDLEDGLYDELGAAAREAGWVFVDLRPVLRKNAPTKALYNSRDLHVNEASSELIGRQQALRLLETGELKRSSSR